MYSESTIRDYLNELASRSPVPGGGSAAALIGAVGCALLSKVANFTIGKEKYKIAEEEMKTTLKLAEDFRENFLKLCSDDAKAYKILSDAFKLPKGSSRDEKVEAALKEALKVPLEVCKTSRDAIKLCVPLAKKGNVNLITDAGDGSLALNAAFETALLNVEINLKCIKDEKFKSQIREMVRPMRKEVKRVNQKTAKLVEGEVR